MKNTKKNLILGVAKGYNYDEIKPFIISLKNSGFEGDLCLFVSNINMKTYKSLIKQGVKLVSFTDEFPFIPNISDIKRILPNISFNKMDVDCSRYIMYYIYLFIHGKKYSNVMLTDVRDVAFQRDPFDFKHINGLCCFLEDKHMKINKCGVNSGWIKHAFGEKILEEIGHNYISCSGVTIGETSRVMKYLKQMIDWFTQIKLIRGIDQGIHNYLIYTNQLDEIKLFENEEGPVYTVGHKRKNTFRFNKEGLLINDSGMVINVLHQYDRHDVLIKYVCKKNKLNYTKIRLIFSFKKFISDFLTQIKFFIHSSFNRHLVFSLSKLYKNVKRIYRR
ncbi:MAG: hypothetical protein ACTSO9_09615 [Candidatus Helarchaeota archaeon]